MNKIEQHRNRKHISECFLALKHKVIGTQTVCI